MLSLAILEGKNCNALKSWTENKDENYLIITEANQGNKTYVQTSFVLHAKVNLKFQWQKVQFVSSEKCFTCVGDFSYYNFYTSNKNCLTSFPSLYLKQISETVAS